MEFEALSDMFTTFGNGLRLFKDAIGLAKDTKDLLPEGDNKTAVEKSLEAAEKASKLAEVQIAQGLGYRLCQCTFPPQIMLSIGYKEHRERFRCPNCEKILPLDTPPIPAPSYSFGSPHGWMAR